MTRPNPDRKADIEADRRADKEGTSSDRHEPISLMEPMLISESSRFRNGLADLAVEIAARSAGFRRSLSRGIVAALADLVRSMNCYYSNLIEGHDTHPIDIERALKNDYSKDVGKRNLQLEAKAHIEVQRWIDEGFAVARRQLQPYARYIDDSVGRCPMNCYGFETLRPAKKSKWSQAS